MSSEGVVYFPTAAGVELHDLHPSAKAAITKYRPLCRESWIEEYEHHRVNAYNGIGHGTLAEVQTRYVYSLGLNHYEVVMAFLVPLTFNHPPLCKKFATVCPVAVFVDLVQSDMLGAHSRYGPIVDGLKWGGHFDKCATDDLFKMFHAHPKMVCHVILMRPDQIRARHASVILRARTLLWSRIRNYIRHYLEFGLSDVYALSLLDSTIALKAHDFASMKHCHIALRRASTHNLSLRQIAHPLVFKETLAPWFDIVSGFSEQPVIKKQCC